MVFALSDVSLLSSYDSMCRGLLDVTMSHRCRIMNKMENRHEWQEKQLDPFTPHSFTPLRMMLGSLFPRMLIKIYLSFVWSLVCLGRNGRGT